MLRCDWTPVCLLWPVCLLILKYTNDTRAFLGLSFTLLLFRFLSRSLSLSRMHCTFLTSWPSESTHAFFKASSERLLQNVHNAPVCRKAALFWGKWPMVSLWAGATHIGVTPLMSAEPWQMCWIVLFWTIWPCPSFTDSFAARRAS